MIKDRIQSYVLEFCSIERVKNDLTRVKRAFSGTTDNAVLSICRDNLETKKNIIIEETKTNAKYVAPRIKPIAAIKEMQQANENMDWGRSLNTKRIIYENKASGSAIG